MSGFCGWIGMEVGDPGINNIFAGGGRMLVGRGQLAGNVEAIDPKFVDQAGYDYRLAVGSPAIDAGTELPEDAAYALFPVTQYVHPLGFTPRARHGKIDAGAYEYAPR